MWGFNIIKYDYCGLTGMLNGVTVQIDNGDTQYLTVQEYNKFIKNRKEKYGERNTVPLDENQKRG
jgi:hypothetical protein